MKTSYSPEQLSDPMIAQSEAILRKCVHCGLCTSTCSSYVVLGDERASPRGRIYAINKMLKTGKKPSKITISFFDNCLTCLSCMTTCPSGVDYVHLIDMARARINKGANRPLPSKIMRKFLAGLLPYSGTYENRHAAWHSSAPSASPHAQGRPARHVRHAGCAAQQDWHARLAMKITHQPKANRSSVWRYCLVAPMI